MSEPRELTSSRGLRKSRNSKIDRIKKEKAAAPPSARYQKDDAQRMIEPYLLGGEQIVHSTPVSRHQIIKGIICALPEDLGDLTGVLLITNFRLIFISNRTLQSDAFIGFFKDKRKSQRTHWTEYLDFCCDFIVSLATISRVEKRKNMVIKLHCKDFRIMQLSCGSPSASATGGDEESSDDEDLTNETNSSKRALKRQFIKIVDTISVFAFPKVGTNLFAYYYAVELKDSKKGTVDSGWKYADIQQDYLRMNLPSDKWRISTVNKNWEFSETYPNIFVVPKTISDKLLKKVAPFRSKGRIPVLSWLHPVNGASITRASQPLVGLGQGRNREDEQLVREIILANPRRSLKILDARPKVNATANKARGAGYENVSRYGNNEEDADSGSTYPAASSYISKERGYAGEKREGAYKPKAGQHFFQSNSIGRSGMSEKDKKALDAEHGDDDSVEDSNPEKSDEEKVGRRRSKSETDFPELERQPSKDAGWGVYVFPLEFLGIENIHVMRDAERRLKDLCFGSTREDKGWYSALEGTRWLEHINLLLSCTRKIVLSVQDGISVFTHCSDGWDRTSQLTSLPMLCLDPYYRTIEGFAVLVEREWLAIGHKFAKRYGHGDKHYDDKDRSPIFLQFIDCVWQLKQQFPTCFEFNQLFLATVMDAVYSCQYGTFLFNSQKERDKHQVKAKTMSLWTFIELEKPKYVDRSFRDNDKSELVPVSGLKNVNLWNYYYMRYSQYNEHNDFLWYVFDGGHSKVIKKKKKRTDEKKKIRELEKTIKAMEKEKHLLEKKNRELLELIDEGKEDKEDKEEDKYLKKRKQTEALHTKIVAVEKQNETLRRREAKLKRKLDRKDKQMDTLRKQIDTHLEEYAEAQDLLALQKKKEKWMKNAMENMKDVNVDDLEAEWENRLDLHFPNWRSRLDKVSEKEPDEITELFIQPPVSALSNSQHRSVNFLGSQRLALDATQAENEDDEKPNEAKGKGEEKSNGNEDQDVRRKRQKSVSEKHRSVGKKIMPFLIRRPTRAELVDRRILLEEDLYEVDVPLTSSAPGSLIHPANRSPSHTTEEQQPQPQQSSQPKTAQPPQPQPTQQPSELPVKVLPIRRAPQAPVERVSRTNEGTKPALVAELAQKISTGSPRNVGDLTSGNALKVNGGTDTKRPPPTESEGKEVRRGQEETAIEKELGSENDREKGEIKTEAEESEDANGHEDFALSINGEEGSNGDTDADARRLLGNEEESRKLDSEVSEGVEETFAVKGSKAEERRKRWQAGFRLITFSQSNMFIGELKKTQSERESQGKQERMEAKQLLYGWKRFFKLSDDSVLKNKLSLLTCSLYALLGALYVFWDEVYPLWAIIPQSAGGLAFSTADLGIMNSIGGGMVVVIQLFIYHRIARHLGLLRTFRFGSWLAIPGFIAFPMLNWITPMWIGLLVVFMVRQLASQASFSAVMTMIVNSVDTRNMGSVNGLGQSLVALTRGVGPYLGGILFSWSVTSGLIFPFNGYFCWLLMCVGSFLCIVFSYTLPRTINKPKREQEQEELL